jgi:hypothetical protein
MNCFTVWNRFAWTAGDLWREAVNGYVVATSKLYGSTAQLARRALKPVHTRVSSNLKRLGKVSK